MFSAALYGASSGALHALTGPDHLLSLGPIALRHPRSPWRVGLAWGVGHGLGTLLLGLPAIFLTQRLHLPVLASWSDRLAGSALVATALWSWWSLRHFHGHAARETRSPLWVGLVHGVTGAAALLLMLPAMLQGSVWYVALFLGAFAVGGALAMATLTEALARLGSRLPPRTISRVQRTMVACSLALGISWLF